MNSGMDAEGSCCELNVLAVIMPSLAGSVEESQKKRSVIAAGVLYLYLKSLCIKLSHGRLVLRGV